MGTRISARASLRFALLAACLGLTGTAVAATSGAVEQSRAQTAGEAAPEAQKAQLVARTTGRASRHVRRGSRVRVRGALQPALAGRSVRLQLKVGRRWKTVDRAHTRRDGRFAASWRPVRTGRFRLRVRFRGDSAHAAVSRVLRGRLYVYRPSFASWYGPGFYGRRTACGQTVTPRLLGVAHKSLRCGTRVTFRYHGRSVTVPVIDRGPYVAGREWDLTAATKRRLGFGSTGTVLTTR